MRWPVVALPFVMLLALLAPNTARADALLFAVLTPKIDSGATPDLQWQIVATLAGELEDSGFQVLLPHEINAKLTPEQRACDKPDCAAQIKRMLFVDGIAAVSLAQGSLRVALVDAAGHTFSGHANVSAEVPVNQATLQALRQALAAQGRGPGPWLIIRGEPAGASVLLNDKPVGNLPHVQTVAAPGVNQISVRAEGYEAWRESRTLPTNADEVVEVVVQLKPVGASAKMVSAPNMRVEIDDADEPRVKHSSIWNHVIGWSGVALGALFLVKPIESAASSGDCAQRVNGTCTRSHQFSSTAVWHTLGGIALLGAGVTVLIVRPITVNAAADRDHALLQVSGSF